MTDRKKPGWTFWMTVVLIALPLLYVVSFGPWCWAISGSIRDRGDRPSTFYRPILWVWLHGPKPTWDVVYWYANLGSSEDNEVQPGEAVDDGPWPKGTMVLTQ